MTVRLFAGFDVPEGLCGRDDFVETGYARGVPMGGELHGPPPGAQDGAGAPGAPRLAVWALRDPGRAEAPGVPLERVQIVKGWREADGTLRQRVVDVAGPAETATDAVDPASCAPPEQGPDDLCTVWEDPDFDPTRPAFWYARVLQRPTCRWHAFVCAGARVDCAAGAPAGLEACCEPELPRTVRERAWTSPIWYRPAREGPAGTGDPRDDAVR